MVMNIQTYVKLFVLIRVYSWFQLIFKGRRKFFSVKVTDDLFLKVFVFVIFGSLSVWFVFC